MITQVLDPEAIRQVADQVSLDTSSIPSVARVGRVNYSEVLELARQMDVSHSELHAIALRNAVADGSGVSGATTDHYRLALASIVRLREATEPQRDVADLLSLLESDDD